MSTEDYGPAKSAKGRKPDDYAAMVLLVDDQLIIAEAVRRALAGEADIDFHFCAEPAQAISIAEQIGPTIILQDLVMPGVDGLSLVRAYRSHEVTQRIPVVVLSSRDEPKAKGDAFAAGANDYMVKLPDRIELIARIRYHTRAYLNQVQRDEAYSALRESQRQLMEANLELQRLMNVDGLTGLNNRRRFDEYAHSEWRRAAREHENFSVLVADVDDFKRYNDTYGHIAGDAVLKQVAAAIRASCSRPGDLAARFGGEEFAVILPGTGLDGAKHVGEAIRKAIEDLRIPHSAATTGTHVSLSIGGITIKPQQQQSLLEVIVSADKALYEAKHQGKNRVQVSEWNSAA
jgi:two-component system chemotaxis family response regulator WspR